MSDAEGDALCVVLHYAFPSGEFYGTPEEREQVARAEEGFEQVLARAGLGDVDGDEVGGGEVVLFVYGRDGDEVWAALDGPARAVPFRPAHAEVLTGGDARRRIDLD